MVLQLLFGQGPITRRTHDDNWVYAHCVWEDKDNENLAHKMRAAAQNMAFAIGIPALVDITCFPRTEKGLPMVLKRTRFWGLPAVGGALAYVATVHTMSNLRGGKNSPLNHFFGGIAWGLVIGKCSNSVITGGFSAIALSLAGAFTKEVAMNGQNYSAMKMQLPRYEPAVKAQRFGGPFAPRYDFTTNLHPKRPGYWVRDEKEIPEVIERGPYGQYKGISYYPTKIDVES